jgi:hypothetical protein
MITTETQRRREKEGLHKEITEAIIGAAIASVVFS